MTVAVVMGGLLPILLGSGTGRRRLPLRMTDTANRRRKAGPPMRFDLPDEKKLVFAMTIPIPWGAMDAMGHVNNTSYFRYFAVIRIE